ncbi:MAG: ASCH domain-containing protein [Sphaerospermopsis sp. SIO1G1]|nr:ASCH domain-containing protein [Sphaerospermopsis sp. SIO1G1]
MKLHSIVVQEEKIKLEENMKSISIWQPWASMISCGYKKVETRSWNTNYRGDLLICSAKKRNMELRNYSQDVLLPLIPQKLNYENLPFGQALAICKLVNCFKMTSENISIQSNLELQMGYWEEGRFAWQFSDIRPLDHSFPVVGKQGFF